MAAHCKTGVEQILRSIEEDSLNEDILWGAVNLDCFTADDDDLWHHIYDFLKTDKIGLDLEEFKNNLMEDLVRLTEKWNSLDRPDTREEWYRAEYREAEYALGN